jgi:hypothetical protein
VRRLLRVCAASGAAALLGALAMTGSAGGLSAPTLRPDGVGPVRFGGTKAAAVAELSHLFGHQSAAGINTGCGPRYTEVEWGDLVAEFRQSRFTGYRFVKGGYPLTTPGSPREASPPTSVFLKLATATGISLGSTLAQLRRRYRVLRRVGSDAWQTSYGFRFAVDAQHDPVPPSSRVIEIKIGTCGDF